MKHSFGGKNKGGRCYFQERLPDPKIYEKASITGELLKKGKDESTFKEKGGLSKRKYDYFMDKLTERQLIIHEIMNNVSDEDLSGQNPLKNVSSPLNSLKTLKIRVILVDFEDRLHTIGKSFFNDLLFSSGKNYSVKDYFQEVSSNKFDINGEVEDWVTLGKYDEYLHDVKSNGKYYEEPDYAKIVNSTGNKLKASLFIKTEFDVLIFVIAGQGADRTSKSTDVSPRRVTFNEEFDFAGKKINSYILVNELPEYDIGKFCHELSHSLGLPDLYMKEGLSMVAGRWCLMAAGSYNDDGRKPAHLSAWCKKKLGWADLKKIEGNPKFYEMPSVYGNNNIYKLELTNSAEEEYFLLENRQKEGFDSAIPHDGLLIWHINEDGFYGKSPNLNKNNLALTLKQADGELELEQTFSEDFLKAMDLDMGGDGGDVFPGDSVNRSFSDSTKPDSKSYSGHSSGIIITDISDSDKIMKAKMGYELHVDYSEDKMKLHLSSKSISSHQYNGYKKGFSDGYVHAMKASKLWGIK